MGLDLTGLGSLFDFGSKLIDKLIPDPAQREAAKLELLKQQQAGQLDEMKIHLSAILAEAQSPDKWTSRARPGFLWLFYFVVLSLVVIAPIIGVFYPDHMVKFFENVAAGFKAIPEPMWWTFTTGYLGYTAARQYGKVAGSDK